MKINKSRTDCQSLVAQAQTLDKAYAQMELIVKSGSGNAEEKQADLQFIRRKRDEVAKMIGWWTSDIARIDDKAAKAEAAKAKAKEPAATAVPAKAK